MANEYIRKEWAGGVVRSTLTAGINASVTTFSVVDGSSFPSGVKPFVLVIDRGTATEEKLIITSRTGNSFTVLQRGYDGSSGQTHAAGAYVEHVLDAYTVDQANAIASTMTTQGDILYKTVTGDNTSFGRLGVGTSGYPIVSAGTAPAYQQLGSTGIASTAVTAAKINADVAGLGLVKNGGTGALDVNVDGSTLEINTDIVRVKDGGITSAKILDGAILDIDINAGAAIAYSKLAALTSGQILVGNGSNVPTARTVSGDITLSNLGVASIAANAVVKADLANTSGEIAGAWTTFTFATARGTDTNLTGATLDGAYNQIGKTVHFRAQLSCTATAAAACVVGLPSVIGTSIGFVQPVNAILTSGGTNKKSVTARIDSSVTARVQFYADADGTAFTAGASIVLTITGTFEVA